MNEGRYENLKGIRTNPKTVEVFDTQTGETNVFTSTYKARRALGINSMYVKDGTIWKKRYDIKVVGKIILLKILKNRKKFDNKMAIVKRFNEYVKSKFNRLADWVTKHAPPMPKIVDDVWNFVKNSVQQLRGKKSPEPGLSRS